ncbi:alpha/beta hydrolase [Maribacter sp. 2210JD10-5]|uniref:alpha/beta hydrolase n=1 Tax=Maribacter sp. 2210JD10-5 TaxID=3386272 RepID=UPI0039BC8395
MKTANYITLDSGKLFFQKMGSGPVIVLLHPSPHTSNLLLPMAQKLAERYTVIALDTPGYGNSDGLGFKPKSVRDYTNVLHKAFTALHLKKPSLYGSATGAQIAIRYALEHSDGVAQVYLDNAAHFNDDLRVTILKNYFFDLSPKKDGSHLVKIWKMVGNMFQYFPWCFQSEEFALKRPQLPAMALHMVAMDYLRAGETYDYAYRVAFEHEKAEYVQALTVPTTIFRWNGSIIKKHIDNLLKHDFPSNVSVFPIDGDPTERMKLMTEYIKSKSNSVPSTALYGNVKPFEEKQKPEYHIGNQNIPEIKADGSHLLNAWNILRTNNPDLGAKKLQACLVDWYSSPDQAV